MATGSIGVIGLVVYVTVAEGGYPQTTFNQPHQALWHKGPVMQGIDAICASRSNDWAWRTTYILYHLFVVFKLVSIITLLVCKFLITRGSQKICGKKVFLRILFDISITWFSPQWKLLDWWIGTFVLTIWNPFHKKLFCSNPVLGKKSCCYFTDCYLIRSSCYIGHDLGNFVMLISTLCLVISLSATYRLFLFNEFSLYQATSRDPETFAPLYRI